MVNKEVIMDGEGFKTEKFEITLISPNLLLIRMFEDQLIETEDIQLIIEHGLILSPSDDTKLIVLMEPYSGITKEAREYVQYNMRTLKAEAHVIPSLAFKIMFNLFIKLRKNKHPIKAFDNLDLAKEWIERV